MPAYARIARGTVGLVLGVLLGASAVTAQSGASAASQGSNPASEGGHWVIGALLDPFSFMSGTPSIGPVIGASSSSSSSPGGFSTTVTRIGVAGTVGYMLPMHLEFGARLAYGQDETKVTGPGGFGGTTSSNAKSFGVYARYWLAVGALGAFQFAAQYTTSNGASFESSGYGPIVGYSIFLNKHVSFDILVPFEITSIKDVKDNVTSVGLALGLSVFVP